MEEDLLPLPPKKNQGQDTGDNGLPLPPKKKYRSLITRLKEYYRAILQWLDDRPNFPSKWEEPGS